MGKTSIEWTKGEDGTQGRTWNPVRGCSRVSPGCTSCYAERQAFRFSRPGEPFAGFVTKVNGHAAWTGKVAPADNHLLDPLSWRKPARVFVNSMSDLFHEGFSDEVIDRVFAVMLLCPQHTFQILTKRAQRMYDYFKNPARVRDGIFAALHDARVFPGDPRRAVLGFPSRAGVAEGISKGWRSPLEKHIWLGVSVEDRQRYEERVPLLRKVPAVVRFLSIEPLLEDLGVINLTGISWAIIGGESGPGARRFEIEWMRSIVEQCRIAKVPPFCKQIGSNPYWAGYPLGRAERGDRKGGDMDTWPESVCVREFPEVA